MKRMTRKPTTPSSSFRSWLARGDLRSDGQANEVAELVGNRLELLPDLMDALTSGDDATRGHAADALEKVARSHPDALSPYIPVLAGVARRDVVGMVRWHLAMVLGHTAMLRDTIDTAEATLIQLLGDGNALVRSWAITSLCIVSRLYPGRTPTIVEAVSRLAHDRSAAVAKRAGKAVELMTLPSQPFPKGWIKCERIRSAGVG
jgi:HEAT repeat protein